MKLKYISIIAILAAVAGCARETGTDYSAKVNPFAGTGGHGHVFVGANVPYGMVQLGPQQIKDAWDWCSGYHYSDTLVIGFGHTHLSGTGIGDLGDIVFLPYNPNGKVLTNTTFIPHKGCDVNHIYAHLDHSLETLAPGFYSVKLPDYGVEVSLTATERAGFHKYVFTSDESAILVDLCSGINWDDVTDYGLDIVSDTAIEGFRRSTGWAKDQQIFFHAEFSQPFTKGSEFNMAEDENATSLIFNTSEQKTIYAKVGISSVSTANAKANLEAEIRGWDFDRTAEAARAKWNKSLGCIEIEGISTEQETIFYTSLYHTMVAPSLFSDTDLSYRGADGNVHKGSGNTYTTFSLWDTYRTASPLMTIINPQMCKEIGSTMVNIWKEQGKLPVWHLHGNETDCMVGNPGVIVLGDLVMKGLYENVPEALQAMKESSLLDERGMELLKVYGYIPFDKSAEVETVAKGLEFAIADAAVAKVAEKAGDNEATAYFGERMLSYKNYFDPETGFMRGRAADGSFRTPFDPFLALHMRSDYTEGNAWQYTWLVPQDVDGLIGLFGGKEAFLNKLSEFFTAEGDLGPDANDVTGLIGQYAHGNEPSHHVAYLFSHIGEYDLCAEYVRKILRELYRNDSDGICGNEDVGQMSAWYVMSSLGFYQIDPCGGDFIIGSPAVKKAVIHLPEGKTFTISAPGNSEEKVYVKSVKLNGVTLKDRRFSYEDLMKGGVLEFEM